MKSPLLYNFQNIHLLSKQKFIIHKISFMKKVLTLALFFLATLSLAQNKTENIIIVTTDGFRWQEVFGGMDKEIAVNKKFNQYDSTEIFKQYWSDDVNERRKKLLPFVWNTIVEKGQIYGNRNLGNKVNVSNPYWFSYPGYSEIFCGYVDTAVNSNGYKPNPNTNVLEFLNKQKALAGKVAAFGAWDAFDRILNEQRSQFPVICGFDTCGGNKPNEHEKLLNAMLKDSYKPFGYDECLDVFTNYAAMETLKNKHPRVLYISYGETDEWAHHAQYKSYLEAAHQVDKWLNDLWNYIQSNPQYKNKTTLFITCDHGRGDIVKSEWTSHGSSIKGANEIWFAVIGPDTKPLGEIKTNEQLYQKQFAATIANLLGYQFTCEHPVAEPVPLNK